MFHSFRDQMKELEEEKEKILFVRGNTDYCA